MSRPGLIIAIFLLSPFITSAQPRRPMTPNDVLRLANVSDAQISPNGQWVVYTVSTVDDDKTVNTLWLVRAEYAAQPSPTPTRRPTPYADWPEIRTTPRTLLPSGW